MREKKKKEKKNKCADENLIPKRSLSSHMTYSRFFPPKKKLIIN